MNTRQVYDLYKQKILDKNIVAKLAHMSEQQIQENFSSSLEFGTAGMRGVMQLGTNCINELTVAKLAQSVSEYLKNNYSKPSCVVCFDTRLNSKTYSRIFANVLDYNGIETYLFKDFAPTPLSIFAIKEYHTTLGVMITASHNPKKYNGIKVCDCNGIQIDKTVQQEISNIFNNTDEIEVYNKIYDRKLSEDVVFITKDLQTKFIGDNVDKTSKNLKIIYTPLNGTGYYCVSTLLKNNGFKFICPNTQKNPNGNFPTCPYPNPEFIEAFAQSLSVAKKKYSDIIVATDPDADRMGVMVKHHGEYIKLSGNEVGYIFADYLLQKNNNPNKFVVTTVVTSPLIDEICKFHNATLYKTLTGFMSLGIKTRDLTERYGEDAFVLEYEESCGYVVNSKYYDKDGIYATLLICQIANELKSQNKTLIDYLNDIYEKTTYLCDMNDSVKFSGVDCNQQMSMVIDELRKNPPKTIGEYSIEKVVDYLYDDTGVPQQNFLEYYATNGLKFILRPSGTEPKLKIYLFHKGKNQRETQDKAAKVLSQVKALLQ